MTKEQLKYLAMLPQVIDALNAFATEAEAVRAAAARVGLGGPPPQATMAAPPNRWNPSAQIQHFNSPASPPSTEEQAVGLDPNAPAHLQDVKAERARFLRQMKQADPARAAKLAQFKHDSGEVEEDVVATTALNIGGGNG